MIIQAGGDLSRRLAPLSPKGKAFYSGVSAPLSPKGKAFYSAISVPLSLKGKAFPQNVKTFCFSDSALESKRQKVFPLGWHTVKNNKKSAEATPRFGGLLV